MFKKVMAYESHETEDLCNSYYFYFYEFSWIEVPIGLNFTAQPTTRCHEDVTLGAVKELLILSKHHLAVDSYTELFI